MDRASSRTEAVEAYHGLVGATLRVLDALSVLEPDGAVLDDARRTVADIADRLERLPHLPEDPRMPSHDPRNPRFVPHERGLAPAMTIEREGGGELRGRVTFGLRFAGAAAVHGGAITLFFDDFLGRLANYGMVDNVARTAYLKVDYRQLTPLCTALVCKARVVKVDGRKRYLRATLEHERGLLAEAEGLWVVGRTDPTDSQPPRHPV